LVRSGFKKPTFEYPVDTNIIPRQIPQQAWYIRDPYKLCVDAFSDSLSDSLLFILQ